MLNSGLHCIPSELLTDNDFTYGGTTYTITGLRLVPQTNTLVLRLNNPISDSLKSALTLHVGNSQFAFAEASVSSILAWSNPGLSWSAGDTVQVKLTTPGEPFWTGVDLYGGDMVHTSDGAQYMDLDEGGAGTFLVRLDQAPTATVTVTIGKLSTFGIDDFDAVDLIQPQTLTFTTSNWQTGQSVALRAATDGDGADDRIIISASVSIASSANANDPYRNPERVNGFVLTVTDTTTGGM